MNISQMRTLIAVIDSGSFAAAGNIVSRSHSAISLQIKGLEEELGVQLFDRVMRPPAPTRKALALAEHARTIIAMIDSTEDVIRDQVLRGKLTVGAVPTVLGSFLPPALAQLRTIHPDLSIDVRSGSSSDLAAQLQKNELDVVVCTKPYQPIHGLDWHFIQHEPCVVVAPQDITGDARDLLTNHPFIWFNRKTWAGGAIEAALKTRGITVNATMEIDSMDAIASMIRVGLGVSILPICRGTSGRWPGLRSLPFGDPPFSREIGALIPSRGTIDPTTRAFLAAL